MEKELFIMEQKVTLTLKESKEYYDRLIEELKEQADELISFGDSREKAEGHGMMTVINRVNKFLTF
jgi:hypothetical protein